jgi:hypothetical protein
VHVKEVVTEKHYSIVHKERSVKVCEHKEPRKPEMPPPERIRHPRVQSCVIRRRSIIGDYRRPFVIVIVVYHRVVGIRG